MAQDRLGHMVEYRWEPLNYLLQTGLHELGERSWQENGYEKDLLTYNPDWHKYQRLQDENVLRFLAVRDNRILIGYASIIVTQSFHDRNITCAIVQDIYLSPEYRKGFAAVRFLWFLEEQLKHLNVNNVSIGERLNGRPTGKLFEYLGYKSEERIWTKALEGNA